MSLTGHIGDNEVAITGCSDESSVVMNEDGTGFIHDYVGVGPLCRSGCDGVSEPPSEVEWPFQIEEGEFGLQMAVRVCLQPPGGAGGDCNMGLEVNEESPHRLAITLLDEPCGSAEFDGEWELEGEDGIELVHEAANAAPTQQKGIQCIPRSSWSAWWLGSWRALPC
jgi:hypothetical protein